MPRPTGEPPPFSRILVALDGSERAPGVFLTASRLAERFGARLHVLRAVWIPPEFPAAAAGHPVDRLPGYATREAERELSRITRLAPAACVEAPLVVVTRESPWRLIVTTATELDVDLIVIGSHGYHGMDRILGTTAGRVANHATRDVLVVHERQARPRRSANGRPHPRPS